MHIPTVARRSNCQREKLTDQIVNELLMAFYFNESKEMGFPNGHVKYGTLADKVEHIYNNLSLISEVHKQSKNNHQ